MPQKSRLMECILQTSQLGPHQSQSERNSHKEEVWILSFVGEDHKPRTPVILIILYVFINQSINIYLMHNFDCIFDCTTQKKSGILGHNITR